MRCAVTAYLLFVFSIVFAQQLEFSSDQHPADAVWHKDSIGNIVSYDEAKHLLKEGNYVLVPTLNMMMGVDRLIKKKTLVDSDKYKTYTNGTSFLSTVGLTNTEPKYQLGDTLPTLTAYNFQGKISILGNDDEKNRKSLILFVTKNNWNSIENDMSKLIHSYPFLDFIICPLDKTHSLENFFLTKTLKNIGNIFILDENSILTPSASDLPYYYLVDEMGKIEMFIPPLPNKSVAIAALSKYFEYLSKSNH